MWHCQEGDCSSCYPLCWMPVCKLSLKTCRAQLPVSVCGGEKVLTSDVWLTSSFRQLTVSKPLTGLFFSVKRKQAFIGTSVIFVYLSIHPSIHTCAHTSPTCMHINGSSTFLASPLPWHSFFNRFYGSLFLPLLFSWDVINCHRNRQHQEGNSKD